MRQKTTRRPNRSPAHQKTTRHPAFPWSPSTRFADLLAPQDLVTAVLRFLHNASRFIDFEEGKVIAFFTAALFFTPLIGQRTYGGDRVEQPADRPLYRTQRRSTAR